MKKRYINLALFIISIFLVSSCSKKKLLIEKINSGNKEKVKELISQGINLDYNEDTSLGQTPLMRSIEQGDLSLVKLLVDAGASIDKKNNRGGTPLYCAVEINKIHIAEYLLSCGANINYVPPDSNTRHASKTLLSRAAINGSPEMVKLLIDNKADVSKKDRDGRTALWYLVERINFLYPELKDEKYNIDYIKTLKLLIAKDADVNNADTIFNRTPLHLAASKDNVELLKILLNSGAKTNLIDKGDKTALDIAIYHKHTKIIALLRKHGAKTAKELKAEQVD